MPAVAAMRRPVHRCSCALAGKCASTWVAALLALESTITKGAGWVDNVTFRGGINASHTEQSTIRQEELLREKSKSKRRRSQTPRPRSVLGYFNSLLESKVGFWVATTVTAALMTSAVSYYQNWSKSGTKDLSSGGIAYVRAASSFISAAMDACAPVSVSPLVVLGCKPVPCTLARGGTIQQQMMIPLACRA